jgi:hypothetical protein
VNQNGSPIRTLNPNLVTDPNFIKGFGDPEDFKGPAKGEKPNNIKFDKDLLANPSENKFFHRKQGTRLSSKTPALSQLNNLSSGNKALLDQNKALFSLR